MAEKGSIYDSGAGYMGSSDLSMSHAHPPAGFQTSGFVISSSAIEGHKDSAPDQGIIEFAIGQTCMLTTGSPGPCYAYTDNLDPSIIYLLWNSQP